MKLVPVVSNRTMIKANLHWLLASISILFLVTIFVSLVVNSVKSAMAEHVVISEVQLGSAGLSNDEFVEIYNPTSSAIDISGWTISRKTALGTEHEFLATIPADTQILVHGYYLIAHSEYDGTVAEDLTYTEEGALASNNAVYLKNSLSNIVDKVGLGNSNDFETLAKGNPATGGSVERKANSSSTNASMTTGVDALLGNGEDTDNNSTDFINRTSPDPQNSNSPVEPEETPTPTPTDSPEPSDSPQPSESPSPTPSDSPQPTDSPSPTPTEEPSPTPTVTPTPTPSNGPFSSIRFFSCSVRFISLNFGFRKVEIPMLSCR